MFRTIQTHKIEIRQMQDGQWWFHADNSDAMQAIEQMLKQIKGELNV